MSEPLLAALWPSDSVAAATVDAAGTVIETNAALDGLAGVPMAGRHLTELAAPEQRPAVGALVRDAGPEWYAISAGLAPGADGVPSDYRLWARRSGEDVLVIAEPHYTDISRLNAELLELNDELVRARRQLARAADAERQTAIKLQEGLLPEVPELDGLDVAARYRPAYEGHLVGGDFYDVLDLGETVGLLAGDVRGKGPEAAAATALARYTARAVADIAHDPSDVLTAIHEAVRRQSAARRRHCSAVYARLRRDAGDIAIDLVSGGHPLPLLVRSDGEVETLGAPGTLLGLEWDLDLEDRSTRMRAGDTLLLYTDGLTEARTGGRILGDEPIAEVAARLAGRPADELAAAVESVALEFTGGRLLDDMAIVAVRAL